MALKLPQLPHLGPRTRKVLRYVGIGVLGLITFVFAVQMTLPFERAKDKLIEAMSAKYDITIGKVERGWIPGRVYLNAVSIRSRPAKPGEPVTSIYIERLKGDLGLLALIGGNLKVDFDAKIGAGHLSGDVALLGFGRKGMDLHVDGRALPASDLPMVSLIGLPMSGKLEFSIDLDLPNDTAKNGHTGTNWQKAEGTIEVGCPSGCTFGDGKTKLKPLLKNQSQQAMVQDGIDFGKVDVDNLLAKVDVKNGNLDLTKFEIKSPDGEVHVDYHMKLEPDLNESVVTGCLRFKGSDTLLKKEPKTFAALQTTGAELRNDGLFHIKLADRFKEMKRLNAECGPNMPQENHEPGGINTGIGGPRPNVRPNLTVTPQEAVRPQPVPPVAPAAAAVAPPGGSGSTAVPSAPQPGQPGTGVNVRGMERPPGPEGETNQPGSGAAAGSETPPPPGSGTAGAGNPPNQVLQ